MIGDGEDIGPLPDPDKAGLTRTRAYSKRLGNLLLNPARTAHRFLQHTAARLSPAEEASPDAGRSGSVRDVVQDAQGRASNVAAATFNRVAAGSAKAIETITPMADWFLSTTQGVLASRLSDDLNKLLARKNHHGSLHGA